MHKIRNKIHWKRLTINECFHVRKCEGDGDETVNEGKRVRETDIIVRVRNLSSGIFCAFVACGVNKLSVCVCVQVTKNS